MHILHGFKILCETVFKIRSETCRIEAQFKYDKERKLAGPKQILPVSRSRPKLNYGAGRDFGVGPEFGATRKQPIIPGNSRARSCAGEEDGVTWLDLRPVFFF